MNIVTNRRHFLKTTGSLAVSFSLFDMSLVGAQQAAPVLPGDLKTSPKLSSWLRIEAGGKVRLLVGKVELGQGILTAFTQLCADELDIEPARIVITSGDTFLVPDEGVTAGSQSLSYGGVAVRQASAEARAILLDLAAKKLGVEPEKLTIKDGTISAPDGKKATYWELVTGKELEVPASGLAKIKPTAERRYIGQNMPRLDIPAKATGGQIFIQDLRPEGMLHARMVHPPAYNAKLLGLDSAKIEKMRGVVKIVRDGSFVGVIAEREEQAIAAAEALRQSSQWELPATGPSSETVHDWLLAQKTKDLFIKDSPDKSGAVPANTVEATWRRPYHMHATIGPSTALGTLGADGVMTIQTHSQSVFETGAAIAQMLDMDVAKVRCQHVQGAGCYGHNGADDVAAEVALLARAIPGRPVRLQWSRNDEHKWEPYGSAMVIKTKATLDNKGDILDWTLDLWSTSHGTRPGKKAGNLLPAWMLEKPFELPTPINNGGPNYAADRNGIALYDFPGQKVTTHFIETFAARASSTRGLGAYANVFSIEGFIDELAARAKADPVEYRLRYLKDERARAVLTKAAEMFGWDKWTAEPGKGRGIAFARYKNISTYAAVAMEVAVDKASGKVRVLRVCCAADAGELVSPDGTKNQLEGGIIQSLSWTLKEAVRFDVRGVKSEDWTSYPILTFTEVPPITIELIDRPTAPFLGAGEATQGPTGAALANAVFNATNVRFREMPFTPARVKAGLSA